MTVDEKRACIDPLHQKLSIIRQCELIGLPRASYYRTGSGPGNCRESGTDEPDRRGVHVPPVLRQPQDARLPATAGLSGEPQAGAAPDAPDGTDLGGAQALNQQAGSGAQDLPLPAPRTGNYGTQSSLVFRFHLHPATWRVSFT